MDLSHSAELVVGMLIVAMGAALLARRWRLPYTIVLVLAGLGVALTRMVPEMTLSPDDYKAVCYSLLLPALLFEAALNLKWEAFARNWKAIFTLALPGTLVSIGLVGLLVHVFLKVPLIQALLLGAIISPTDPLSVVAMFRKLGVSKRLAVLVEGESLFNDAIGLVVFTILLDASAPGAHIAPLEGIISFCVVSLGGAVVGAVIGIGASRLTQQVDDHLIEITLSTVTAYGSFMAAEAMQLGGHHFSGIIAVVVAGLLMGNYGKTTGMSATTVVALHTFWEYAAFAVNSIVFLLIGAELGLLTGLPNLSAVFGYVFLVFLILQVARAVVSYGSGAIITRYWQPIPSTWRRVLFWGGLKGALSMVMVLQVPVLTRQWEGFDFLLTATFGVVFLSLMLQGLSVGNLVRRWGLSKQDEFVEQYQGLVGRIVAHRAALDELERLRRAHVVTPRIALQLSGPHRDAIEGLEQRIEVLADETEHLETEQVYEARRLVHHASKGSLLDAFQRGIISEETLGELTAEIDGEHRELEAEREVETRELVEDEEQE